MIRTIDWAEEKRFIRDMTLREAATIFGRAGGKIGGKSRSEAKLAAVAINMRYARSFRRQAKMGKELPRLRKERDQAL